MSETRIEHIIIPANLDHAGLHRLEADVPWCCIYCGATRGEPYQGLSFDGSRRLAVTMWLNPCGHVESYEAIRSWLKLHRELAEEQRTSGRYEIEPRPVAVGGGWRLRLFGINLETGQEIEMGGGVFPLEDGQDEKDAYADAMQTGQEWLQAQEGN